MKKIGRILLLLITLIPAVLLANNQEFTEDSVYSSHLYNKARKLFVENEYRSAIDSFLLSLEIRKKIYKRKNYEIGIIENALGISYKTIGQQNKALDYFLIAEKSYKSDEQINFEALARLYNNIGNVYKNRLDYNTALEYYNRAANIYAKEKQVNQYDIADIYYSIADIYKNTGEYEKSIAIIDKYSSDAYADTKLFFLDLKAAVYQIDDSPEKAEEAYLEAIEEAGKLVKQDYLNEIELAYEYLNYASFLVTVHHSNKASEVLEKAYDIIIKTQANEGQDLAQYYSVLGDYYQNKQVESNEISSFKRQKTKNLQQAINSYKKGLNALNYEFEPTLDTIPDIGQSLSMIQSLDLLKLVADTYAKIADVYNGVDEAEYISSLKDALDYYRVTAEIIQKTRKEITSDDSKIQLAELQQATFHKMIKTAFDAYNVTGEQEIMDFAFKNAERIKASTVFDRLSGELAKNELIPDSLLELEKNLNYEITRKNELVYSLSREEKPDTEKISNAEAALFQLKKQRDELNQFLENSYPSYFKLKYSDQLMGVKEIQKKLKTNEVFIEYVLSESDTLPELYAFLISPNNARFINPYVDSTFIDATVNSFRFMSDSRHMFIKNEDAIAFCVGSHHLYQKLISPFEKEIRDKKLLIVPDGKLNYIAFDALIENLPDTTGHINFAKLDYLIKKNSINYSYSANLLYQFDRKNKKSRNKLLAFAPNYTDDTIQFNNKKMALMPLPGIQKEVELISQEVKTKSFTGDDASEKNFREFSESFDILHLAMHAFIDDSNPAFSSLAFAQNDNDDAENNGRLNTADIYNLDLNARLTVLSACNTGSGELKKGEGVMSLARGFFYAGCPSIVMTLWEVDDKAGTEIMGSFYRNLKKGRSVDESLRLAKLAYLENTNPRMAHPHYWLGYVSIGDSSPLFRSYDYYFFGLLMLALLAVTIDQIIRVRKSRKNYNNK